MQHGIGVGMAGQEVIHPDPVADIDPLELADSLPHQPGQVFLGPPTAEVVDHHDLIAQPVEPAPGMAANESRPTGDDPLASPDPRVAHRSPPPADLAA